MNRINLKQTIKKCIIYYAVFGLVIGIIMFFITMINPTIPFSLGEAKYYGLTAGVLGLLSMPLIMGFVGFTHAIILWYPIIAFIRYLKAR